MVSVFQSFHRGDQHPSNPDLFYWDTWYGQQRWLTKDKFDRRRLKGRIYVAQWQKADPERHKASQKRFRDIHQKRRNAEMREYRNEWKKKRRASDPVYAAYTRCAARVRSFLKRRGMMKSERTQQIIGCSFEQLVTHIEARFQPGMTWHNAGYESWHIDHEIPLASAKTIEDIYRLFHYKNLQPLWKADNFAKGHKLVTQPTQPCLNHS